MVIAQIDQTNLTQYIENLSVIYRNILQKLNSTQLAHQSLSGKIIGCTGDEPYQLKKNS